MKRDYSIDVLKCLAALIITWSHFEKPLGDYSFLATGGAFGDALFFFCSGYTLLLGRKINGFFNWYKIRLNRIYPTVFAWALIRSSFFCATDNMLDIILRGGNFFVSCIMLFYIFYYFIKIYAIKYLNLTLIISILITTCSYFFIDNTNKHAMYIWQWTLFFSVMLLGGIIGRSRQEEANSSQSSILKTTTILALSIVCYYFLMYIEQKTALNMIRMFTILPLLSFSYTLHKLCTNQVVQKVYDNKYAHTMIMAIAGLCLEIYLVQYVILTDKLNNLFPFNLLLMYLMIFAGAYTLRCVSRIWMQTFKDGEYNWKEVFKLI